jgi:hypothetical protein
MREAIQNWLIVLGIIIMSGIIIYFVVPRNEIYDDREVLGEQSVNLRNIPYITSVSPISVEIGESFEYEVAVSDLDTETEQIQIYLTEKPMWMYLNDNIVKGIPTEVGTYKFVISVSDGQNSTSQVNYILVEEDE